MASLSHAQASVAEPVTRPRSRPGSRSRKKSQTRARGGILWIAISGILLAGVVFVNVAVLRLNLGLDAENAALQSQLSSELASPRIQSQAARKLGLVYADPSDYGFVDLTKK